MKRLVACAHSWLAKKSSGPLASRSPHSIRAYYANRATKARPVSTGMDLLEQGQLVGSRWRC